MIADLYKHITDKTVQLKGKTINYQVIAEDFPLKNADGEVEATMFSYSYIAQPHDKTRPVIFAYNGGPGSDSVWLHLGIMGPQRIVVNDPPAALTQFPYEAIANTECMLDICDFVMIDPVGTGFSMQANEALAKKYFETRQDGVAFARLIESWLIQQERWDSPIYLLGESYGTLRNLALADSLSGTAYLAGIISVGTSFNVGQPELHVEPSVRRMEAYAATSWFHYPEGKPSLKQHLEEAWQFAYNEYARALLWGNMLPQNEFDTMLERTHYFTGMSKDYLRTNRLRLDQNDFVRQLCPGYIISAYDGRIKAPAGNPGKWSFKDDPLKLFTKPAFSTVMEKYVKKELGIKLERPYIRDTTHIAMGWDYKTLGDSTMTMLEDIMRRRQSCRVMFVNGVFDLQSTSDFVRYYLAQHNIPKERTTIAAYESGHMTYFGAPYESLCADLRVFVSNS